MFNKLKKFLKSKRAVGSVATAIKVGTACVLGATILVGGVALTNDVILPSTSDKTQAIADYEGGEGGSTGGVTPVNVPVEQGITDLTGTTWVINEEVYPSLYKIDGDDYLGYSINFQSNGNTYSSFYCDMDWRIFYDNTRVKALGPISEEYRIVAITGGADAANPDVIAWFKENAVLVE